MADLVKRFASLESLSTETPYVCRCTHCCENDSTTASDKYHSVTPTESPVPCSANPLADAFSAEKVFVERTRVIDDEGINMRHITKQWIHGETDINCVPSESGGNTITRKPREKSVATSPHKLSVQAFESLRPMSKDIETLVTVDDRVTRRDNQPSTSIVLHQQHAANNNFFRCYHSDVSSQNTLKVLSSQYWYSQPSSGELPDSSSVEMVQPLVYGCNFKQKRGMMHVQRNIGILFSVVIFIWFVYMLIEIVFE